MPKTARNPREAAHTRPAEHARARLTFTTGGAGMHVRLAILGTEVLSLHVGRGLVLDVDALALDDLDEDDDPEPCQLVSGGASHNFERDPDPLSADGEVPWSEADFGFGR
ncbi:hypothetical protein SEA_FINDLEY_89 [Mycobacterium phage Findley]|uniref:Uncharacterized protein n=1 Tax=Mycobacterium phage Findley TaxID=2015882 RepID=A0A222ZQN5_9CAUD|nr:hypothetical protein MILLY_89 [Mycobacterium phage Milly]YP_009951175.1 hypothetical protein I5G77_gp89 [Mycobacterium phage Findley]AJA43761.1 hypothetical protein MILLY_89 [Mycobacterium phage Milly]ASR86828.1 hypothetical protein SEA_FINDLEY_89 [Mycobacterium phage Findley]